MRAHGVRNPLPWVAPGDFLVVELWAGLALLGGVALRRLALLDHVRSPVAHASTQIPLPAGSFADPN